MNSIILPSLQPINIKTVDVKYKYLHVLKSKRKWTYTSDWKFTLSTGQTVVLPKEEETDGASYPWWTTTLCSLLGIYTIDTPIYLVIYLLVLAASLKMMFAPMGVALVPGCIHDYLYKYHYLLLEDGSKFMENCSLQEADKLFKDVHFQVNKMFLLAWVTWFFLRLGSWIVWYRYRKGYK